MYVMRILVIGGTNFMGPRVVRSLSEQGHEVTVFHRGQTQTDLPSRVKEILGDRRSLNEKADELQRLTPELVLDMQTTSSIATEATLLALQSLVG
jgi:nucleoside-diphosphate-sugar epimerase